jgi:hypothetical protein
MLKHFTPRRILILVAVTAVAIAVPVGAYAYFSTTGTGSGTAAVGSATAIQLSSAAGDVTGTLYPGGSDATVVVHVLNAGSGSQYVGDITGVVADNGLCLGSWFVVDHVLLAAEVAKGASTTASTKVRMTNTATNQNICQGKTMAITWSASAAS